MLEVSVSDQGVGMTEEEIQHTFDPFWKEETQSKGVGLLISKQICEHLGGSIQMFSTPNCGSKFVLTMQVFDCIKIEPFTSLQHIDNDSEHSDESCETQQATQQAFVTKAQKYLYHEH